MFFHLKTKKQTKLHFEIHRVSYGHQENSVQLHKLRQLNTTGLIKAVGLMLIRQISFICI